MPATTATTNAQLVERAGRALYGAAWQSPLAVDLGVNLRTMQRIAAAAHAGEEYAAARALLADLRLRLHNRATACMDVAVQINDAMNA